MKKVIQISPRQFAGIMPHHSQTKDERSFNKAHLRAYLKGARVFEHGFEMVGPFRKKSKHRTKIVDRVLQEI